ncbi:2Fe-2S iron-sulfur cluster-binding protein [Emcibacter sp.]|uniref:2Fe-2S iron-sulfur cluster-binding protein n=1 Tax=Emcibacter sp. TaxID=1979954 RepID=UPI002AA74418|nr:2Fe-2S iron-sulfur cluster-binding protein [Emcibacter sp.]
MKSFSIQVSGAEDQAFRCDEDDTILGGALRNGNGFPYECNSGGCGSCQFELIDGEVDELWSDAPGLSPRARERGRRLACQCVPKTDLTIKASFRDEYVPAVMPKRQKLALVGLTRLTSDMSEFSFKAEQGAEFLPGQFAMLGLPGVEGLRAYSMSNLPNDEGLWNFVIKRVPGGKGTAFLFDTLKAGDEISLDGPYGNSYLRTGNGRDIVCVAGGSGLSPVLSILRGAVQASELNDRRLLLFYGGRGPQDICVSDIIAADPLLSERVELHTAISDDEAPGARDWTGERGFVHELVKNTLGEDIKGFDYYFCGPPPMTDAVQRLLLLEYKVPSKQMYFDRFY